MGPVFFLIFINDLDEKIISWLLKFADYTKFMGIVNNKRDGQVLQRDLSRLFTWSEE